jgi:hypothetical protein
MTFFEAKAPRNTAAGRDAAKAALIANRQLDKLSVCPGPRSATTVRNGRRCRGRHLHWYIGEFLVRPGISGPVRCEEVPTFRTEAAARAFLNEVTEIQPEN